jgi:uncharacterized protein (TIGR03067 family)
MRVCIGALRVVGTGAFAAEQAGGNDADKIQGTWTVVSMHDSGRPAPPEKIKSVKFVITKDKMAIVEGGGEKEAVKYALDATKKPKWIDFTSKNGGKMLGVYELDGDNLKICFNERDGGERSTKFASEKDSPNDVLIILKRDKK